MATEHLPVRKSGREATNPTVAPKERRSAGSSREPEKEWGAAAEKPPTK
jgi:hypothetical protein